MPFRKPQRCENCEHWRQADPNMVLGRCAAKPLRVPFWADPLLGIPNTAYTDGSNCEAFNYDKWREHPLDKAPGILMQAQVGDTLTLRTYGIGKPIDRMEAKVVGHSKNFVTVEFLNAAYRIRVDDTQRLGRAGMVVGMPDWGLDVEAEIRRAEFEQERPELAEKMLRNVRIGDWVPLIGYPPLDGISRTGRVYGVEKGRLKLKVGRSKRVMYRTGPMAGIIEGDVFVLDTRDRDASPS